MLSLVTITKSASCLNALELMFKNKIHHLIVMDGASFFGTVSDRDIFYRWFNQSEGENFTLNELPVSSAARKDCPIINPETSLFQIAEWMRNYSVSVLPYRGQDGSFKTITETDLLNILWGMIKRENIFDKFLKATETGLASPTVQKIIEMLSQLGI